MVIAEKARTCRKY